MGMDACLESQRVDSPAVGADRHADLAGQGAMLLVRRRSEAQRLWRNKCAVDDYLAAGRQQPHAYLAIPAHEEQ